MNADEDTFFRNFLNQKKIILNVGGIRCEILRSNLQKLPNSRLGKIHLAKSIETLKSLCDYIDLEKNEIFFDRNYESFSTIINLYRNDRLHLNENICIISFSNDLYYWGLEESLLDSCCFLKFIERKENVLNDIRKDEKMQIEKVEEKFNKCFPKFRKTVWNNMENPEYSKIAWVILKIFN